MSPGVWTNGKDHGGRGVDVAFKPDCAEPSRASYCSRAFESQRDPPPTTTRKISQPGYGSKHFQTTENPEAIIRRNIIDSMGSFAAWVFVSMTISTRDVIRRKHLSSQRRRPNEVMFSRQTQLKRTTAPQEDICNKHVHPDEATSSKRTMKSKERRMNQSRRPRTHHEHESSRERPASRGRRS